MVHPPADAPNWDDLSLAALAERSQLGDREAFGVLYDRLAPLLLGAATRLLRDRREADDLVHDVFLEAWRHIREYEPAKSSVRSWLFLRLRSRALDSLGRAERRLTRLSEADDDMDQAISPLQELAWEQRHLRASVEALEEGVRSILDLTYYEGLTAQEVAQRTGLPLGTVKSRLARGLAALQIALRKGEAADD